MSTTVSGVFGAAAGDEHPVTITSHFSRALALGRGGGCSFKTKRILGQSGPFRCKVFLLLLFIFFIF